MTLCKLWNNRRGYFWSSGKGRDTWSSVARLKSATKTSHFPDIGCHTPDYVIIEYDLVEKSRVEL